MTYTEKVKALIEPLQTSFPNTEWEWNEEAVAWVETTDFFTRFWTRIQKYTGYVPYVFLRVYIGEYVRTENIVVDIPQDGLFTVTID